MTTAVKRRYVLKLEKERFLQETVWSLSISPYLFVPFSPQERLPKNQKSGHREKVAPAVGFFWEIFLSASLAPFLNSENTFLLFETWH